VRSFARTGTALAIVAGLLNLPVFAANDKALGMVVQAQDARLADMNLTLGTTVYPGDSVSTETGGILRLKVGAGQIYLLSATAAKLAQNSDSVQATVTRGTAGFSATPTDKVQFVIPEGILRAADGQASYGQVTIVSANQAIISAYRGVLVLDTDGDQHLINAGSSYRVTLAADDAAQGPEGSETGTNVHYSKRRHVVLDLIILGVVAGGISVPLYHYLTESPSKFN
jgi:hypothetical protein